MCMCLFSLQEDDSFTWQSSVLPCSVTHLSLTLLVWGHLLYCTRQHPWGHEPFHGTSCSLMPVSAWCHREPYLCCSEGCVDWTGGVVLAAAGGTSTSSVLAVRVAVPTAQGLWLRVSAWWHQLSCVFWPPAAAGCAWRAPRRPAAPPAAVPGTAASLLLLAPLPGAAGPGAPAATRRGPGTNLASACRAMPAAVVQSSPAAGAASRPASPAHGPAEGHPGAAWLPLAPCVLPPGSNAVQPPPVASELHPAAGTGIRTGRH